MEVHMGYITTVRDAVTALASSVLDRAVEHVPAVLGAVVLLLLGWVLARTLRAATVRILTLLEALGGRLISTEGSRLRLTRSTEPLGTIVFWIVPEHMIIPLMRERFIPVDVRVNLCVFFLSHHVYDVGAKQVFCQGKTIRNKLTEVMAVIVYQT